MIWLMPLSLTQLIPLWAIWLLELALVFMLFSPVVPTTKF
jgi:hypothetical protein